jgi:Flp pilus assembly protein TadB
MAVSPDDFKLLFEHLKNAHERELEMIRATAAFEHSALRAVTLLNGGALVVYMALYGALTDLPVGWALAAGVAWIFGLILAVIATALGFQSQFRFRKCRGHQTQIAVKKIELEIAKERSDATTQLNLEVEVKELEETEKSHGNAASTYRTIAKWFWAICVFVFIVGVILAGISLIETTYWPETTLFIPYFE